MTKPAPTADLILINGQFTTLERSTRPRGGRDPGRPLHRRRRRQGDPGAGRSEDQGRRPQGPARHPGLIDNHLHIIRGGLNYNMELRWDGVRRLADAMAC